MTNRLPQQRLDVVWFVLVLACSASIGATARAQGGQYRGTIDDVPPSLHGAGDRVLPSFPERPFDRGPGLRRPPSGSSNLIPPSFRRRDGPTLADWEFWWEYNKAPFLDAKYVARMSRGHSFDPKIWVKSEHVRETLIDRIGAGKQEEKAAALIALARSVGPKESVDLGLFTRGLASAPIRVQCAATLALGILGRVEPEIVAMLQGLLRDRSEGRALVGQPNGVDDRIRGLAAASLGLVGDASTIKVLRQAATDEKTPGDVRAMAVLGLGLMPERHETIVPVLFEVLKDESADELVRAQVPIALGKLKQTNGGSPTAYASLDEVVGVFRDEKTDADLRRSLALCIGMLAEIADAGAIDALMKAAVESPDDQVRHFSMMSLAQIGHRDASPRKHAENHQRLEDFFVKQLVNPRRAKQVPYAALGLASYATNIYFEGRVSQRAGEKILEALLDSNNPNYKGAMAIGLGILQFDEAENGLWAEFLDTNHQPLRGYIALSLSMMGVSKSDEYRKLLQLKGIDFKFRVQLVHALALLGDQAAVPALTSLLENAETVAEAAAAAQALGVIADRFVVFDLIERASDPALVPMARGFHAAALGIAAQRIDLPWNWVFSVSGNYRAQVPALAEILSLL